MQKDFARISCRGHKSAFFLAKVEAAIFYVCCSCTWINHRGYPMIIIYPRLCWLGEATDKRNWCMKVCGWRVWGYRRGEGARKKRKSHTGPDACMPKWYRWIAHSGTSPDIVKCVQGDAVEVILRLLTFSLKDVIMRKWAFWGTISEYVAGLVANRKSRGSCAGFK
jgi:hypothetical protein